MMERVCAGRDLSQASNDVGITNNPNLGEAGGLISLLTHGRMDRQDYTLQAIVMALVRHENPNWF
jgi:non-canonical (house-cleaning) NTP pyrophosphatase